MKEYEEKQWRHNLGKKNDRNKKEMKMVRTTKTAIKTMREKASDAGSLYRCGRLGRGVQPPSTPQPPTYTQTYAKSICTI